MSRSACRASTRACARRSAGARTSDPAAAFATLRSGWRRGDPGAGHRCGATRRLERGAAGRAPPGLGIDLIFGLPGQGLADVEAELATVARLRPDHVSWYELGIVPGSALAARVEPGDGAQLSGEAAALSDGARSGREAAASSGGDVRSGSGETSALPTQATRFGHETGAQSAAADARSDRAASTLPDDDTMAAMYRRIVAGLGGLGYDWYEVSNFARPGASLLPQPAVWRGRDYLGLGPGAVGTVGASPAARPARRRGLSGRPRRRRATRRASTRRSTTRRALASACCWPPAPASGCRSTSSAA